MKKSEWWEDGGGFFGRYYMIGDNSRNGYLPGKCESLEQRTRREVEGVIKLLDLRRKQLLLDCPCGYGRHTIELRKRGYNAFGVDINRLQIREARIRYGPDYHGIFSVGDMRRLTNCKEGEYDAVINMFLSFGFFDSKNDNISVMEEFHRVLKRNGKLLIHSDVSPEMFSRGYCFGEKRGLIHRGYLIIDERYDPDKKRLEGTWTLVDSRGHRERLTPYSVRIYSAQEFIDMAYGCGFRSAAVYGSFGGERFCPISKEIILVAKK